MCDNTIEDAGGTAPAGQALAALIATAALAVSTIVVATVVSVGIARANVADNVIDSEGSLFALALLLGLLFIGMGGLTILTLPHKPKSHEHSDSTPHHPTIA